ncbi:MAG TPA: redoxin domain-containing protein, partial [Bacteroidetes bacterium]|nr:redoxin domain-containing protein [Bacteroidota bacterium]
MTAVAVKYPKFQELGVEVISMSVDSPYVHKAWDMEELSKAVEGGIPYI